MKKKRIAYKSNPGFKVPEGYFEEFEDRMMHAISQPAPLSDYKGKSGFAVPQDYFESLETEILAKVREPKPEGTIVPLFKRREFYYAASIAAVLIGIVSTLFLKPNPELSMSSFNSLEISALEYFVEEGNMDLNFNEISSFMFEEDYILQNSDNSNLNEEELFNYLSENVDYADLLEE